MSEELQKRAKAFLERPLPEGMAYVPDSISERFVATYAAAGRLDLNAEMAELLHICIIETDNSTAKKSGEEQAYFHESGEILKAILAERRAT